MAIGRGGESSATEHAKVARDVVANETSMPAEKGLAVDAIGGEEPIAAAGRERAEE